MTRPIFIVGCPRSGTTLLRDLLRSHPHLTFPPESQFIALYYRAYGEPASAGEARHLVRRILGYPRVSNFWRMEAGPEDFAACRTFEEITRRLFEMWAAQEGKPRWGDKTPHYVREIPLLLQLFPDAQVIHVVRDGRDVAVSWLSTKFEPCNVYAAARQWKEMVTKGRRDGALLPPGSYFELRYESLLAEPEATMRRVCEFLGEPYDPAVLIPRRIAGETGRTSRELHVPAYRDAIAGDNAGTWRAAMTLRQRTLFESVAGGLLEELVYPVEGLARKLSRSETLWWEAGNRAESLGRKLAKLRNPLWRRTALSLAWARLRRPAPGRSSAGPTRH